MPNYVEQSKPHEQFLPMSEVTKLVGFKKSWVQQKIAEGEFPRPIKFGRAARWPASKIQSWIDQQKRTAE